MSKKRMGRPRMKAADRKSEPVMLKLTRAERKRLQAEADKAGMRLSHYIMRPHREGKGG